MYRRAAACALLVSALLLSACGLGWPSRQDATTSTAVASADAPTGDVLKAECDQLRSDIRHNRNLAHQAPAESSTPEIVQAAEAKANQRADAQQAHYEQLDCHDEETTPGVEAPKTAPLPAAPGSPEGSGR